MRSLISIRGHAARCTQQLVTLIDDETQAEEEKWQATSVDFPGFLGLGDSPEEAADDLTGKIARANGRAWVDFPKTLVGRAA
jgi:hypothetical protein